MTKKKIEANLHSKIISIVKYLLLYLFNKKNTKKRMEEIEEILRKCCRKSSKINKQKNKD